MGILYWILNTRVAKKCGLTNYIARAVPKEIIDEDRKKERIQYEQTITELRCSNLSLEEQMKSVRTAFNESRRLTLEHGERNKALEEALKFNIKKYFTLEIENNNLKDKIEEEKKETERKLIESQKRKELYLKHIRIAIKSFSEISKRARKLEDSFEERVWRIEGEYEEETRKCAEDYRKDLEGYGTIIDRHNKRADESEKQQIFLQGALIRKEREFIENINGYAKFLFKFGEKTQLSKNVGLIFDRRLEPVYATPRFYEVNGISEDELHKIKIPQLVCTLQDKKEGYKVRYKDHSGKEHMGTIYSFLILNRGGEAIGTYLQIDQTTGDWFKEKAHFYGKGFNLIDLIFEGKAELSRGV